MQSQHSLTRAGSALAVLALTLLCTDAKAQECVDDYIAFRSGTELLTGCAAASSPCSFPTFDVYRVEGGGAALDSLIGFLAYGVTTFTVIDVGPDSQPATQEVYSPIAIPADGFPAGLAIIARWGPQFAAIDGGFGAQCVAVVGGIGDGPIRIGAAANRLVLNDPLLPDYSGWFGFEIRNGAAFGIPDGGGVRVTFTGDEVDLAGNVIHDNQGRNFGGGVLLQTPSSAYVALNHVFDNVLARDCFYDSFPVLGAGIHQSGGNVQLLGNRIEGNDFGELLCVGGGAEPERQGGGVAVFFAIEGGQATHFSCGNKVLDNHASEGNGYWIEALTVAGNAWARLELNEIRANTTWQPRIQAPTAIEGAFQGGGVWMRGRSDALPKPPSTNTLQLELVANRIWENEVANPGLSLADPSQIDDVGGGVYSDVERNDTSDAVAIVGNAVWSNQAPLAGGGLWLRHPATSPTPVSGELHHNTLVRNRVTSTGGVGGGIWLSGDSRFAGSSAIIFFNEIAGVPFVPDGDWYAEPGVPDDFVFTQMPAAFSTSEDLFGVSSLTADPLLVAGEWHLIGNPSPCVDSADPAIEAVLMGLVLTVDPDGGPREVDRLPASLEDRDRGADEFMAFLRGDANADGALDIADMIYMLNALFVGGSPVPISMDAADVNDDGNFDISDPIRLSDYLFGSGSPLPGGVGECLIADPTPDPLTTEPGTPCIP